MKKLLFNHWYEDHQNPSMTTHIMYGFDRLGSTEPTKVKFKLVGGAESDWYFLPNELANIETLYGVHLFNKE